jgi:uncharacterized protein
MLLNLSKIIAEPGKSVEFELDLDPEDIAFSQITSYESAPHAKGCICNTAGMLELKGELTAQANCICDRCGREYPLHKQMDLYAVLSGEESDRDDPDVFPLQGDFIDAAEVVRTLFILSMDTKFLCTPECKGVCPKCGKNLNEGPCDCEDI